MINVMCLCFPDGSNYWHDSDADHTRKIIGIWKSKNPGFDKCSMGAVQLRMPEDSYNRITATGALRRSINE